MANLTDSEVRIAQLKARLSEHLRAVQRGHRITVLDRDTPIARIVPLDRGAPTARPATPPPSGHPGFWDLPRLPPLDLGCDVVEILLKERARR